MKGHQPIIAMRRSGRKPAFVTLTDHDVRWLSGLTVSVLGDTPELLDLRFLVGTTVLVEGPDQARVDRIFEACRPIAARVIGTTIPDKTVTRVIDTAGVATWPT